MNKNDFIGVFLMILIVMIFAALAFGVGLKYQANKAIEAGVAEYIVNPKTGKVQFVYKSEKK